MTFLYQMLGTNYRMWFSKSRYFWKAFLKEMISDYRNNSKWELDSLQLNLVTIIIHLQLLISPKEVTHLSSCYKYHIPNTLDLTSRYKECWAMSLKFKNLLPNLPFWDLLCLWWLSVNSKGSPADTYLYSLDEIPKFPSSIAS